MRRILYVIAAVGMIGTLPACAHYDRARADYHQRRANHAEAKGDYGSAVQQERKADAARRDLNTDMNKR